MEQVATTLNDNIKPDIQKLLDEFHEHEAEARKLTGEIESKLKKLGLV